MEYLIALVAVVVIATIWRIRNAKALHRMKGGWK